MPEPVDTMLYLPVKLEPSAYCPERAHSTDAGLDLRTPHDFHLLPNSKVRVDTGVHVAIPDGCFGLVISKSGLMARGITTRGVIDSSYRGTVQVVMFNHTEESIYFSAGDKISQLIIVPCLALTPLVVAELDDTERGDGGFGSTGR